MRKNEHTIESYRLNMITFFGASHDEFTYVILMFTEFGWELKVLFLSEPFFLSTDPTLQFPLMTHYI